MKPCIGYDFCLSDIHIHAWLSGRMYKIVAATLDSLSFWLEQAPSVAPTPSREGLLFLCVWTGLMKPPGCRWTAAAATGEPHSCGQCCYQGAECPHAAGVRCLWTCVAEKRWCHWNEQKGTMRMWSTCPIVLQCFFPLHLLKRCSFSPGPQRAPSCLPAPTHLIQTISSSSSSAEINPFIWIRCVWRRDTFKTCRTGRPRGPRSNNTQFNQHMLSWNN